MRHHCCKPCLFPSVTFQQISPVFQIKIFISLVTLLKGHMEQLLICSVMSKVNGIQALLWLNQSCHYLYHSLCGVLVGAQLAQLLQWELTLNLQHVTLWTDSTTVLGWLRSESCHFYLFVGTRVAEIQELTNPNS